MNPPTSEEARSKSPMTPARRWSRRVLVAVSAGASLLAGIAAVGLHWMQESREIEQRRIAELAAVADMKMAQLVNWRAERLADARFLAASTETIADVTALIAQADAEPARTNLLRRLRLLKNGERYERIAIFGADARELAAVAGERAEIEPTTREQIAFALKSTGPRLGELESDRRGAAHLDVFAPMFAREGDAMPIAAIVMRIDPRHFLYPLALQWPLPCRTGQVLIARRDGDDVLYLTPLRDGQDELRNLRLPLSRPDLPLAMAIRGRPGVLEGRNYRGEPVVAVVYAVPGSAWFMAAKMNRAEIFEPVRQQAVMAGTVVVALCFAVLGAASWFWRREENAHLRRQLAVEVALHEAEARYRRYIDDAPLGVFVLDDTGHFVELNPACQPISGHPAHELVGQPFLTMIHPRDQETALAHFQRVLESGRTEGVIDVVHKQGWEVCVEFKAVKLAHDRVLGFVSDVTAQRTTEKSLELFRALVDRSNDAIELIDTATGRFIDVNERGCADLGYARADLLAMHVWDIDPTLKAEDWPRIMAQVREAGGARIFETEHRRKDGSVFPVEVNARQVQLDRDYTIAAVRDITERRRAEAELRRLSVVVEQSPAAIVITDPAGTIEYVNQRFSELTGFPAEEAIGKNPRILTSGRHSREFYKAMWDEIAAGRIWRGEVLNRKRGGELYWEWATIAPILDAQGKIAHYVGIKEDITERKQAIDALRESQERFAELAENVGEVFWMVEPKTDTVFYVSPAYERIWGRTCESLYDDPHSWQDAVHPDDRERVAAAHEAVLTTGHFEETYRIVRPDGATRWIRDRAFPVRTEAGELARIVGVAQDITETHRLETQYRQAQKMEAVGQLAGGVAHDFNNILSVITIHSDLLTAMVQTSELALESVMEIQRAAERASSLTRQLLVFSRQQIVEPKVLDLNEVVRESEKMLRRLIGEDISLATSLTAELPAVRIDPGQLNQIIMNLAVNARDAMPQGGQLTIETNDLLIDEDYAKTQAEAKPGHYVRLSVTDTGQGMSAAVLAHIFEPFFTTKETGRGTGLGLSVVHGIVKQAGGHIGVYSEPNAGTTFKIYLPAASGQPPRASGYRQAQAARGTETILLVDDEEAFRRVTGAALEHLGYRVIPAASGAEALKLASQQGAHFDLLLTDVVMPQMGGRELSDRLSAQHPHIKVLYQSGYTDDAVVRHGILQAEVAFLQKPFTLAALAAKVREVLDR